jgi:hypothetical protein
MIYRILLLFVVAAVCVSCHSTEFQSWEGRHKSVVEGRGGTRKVVDGMDVWSYGDPPRRYRVLGIIEDSRHGGRIPMARYEHDIVAKARQSGGDAVILVSSQSQILGYDTSGSATAYGYGNFVSAYGDSTTVPITRHTATFVVIKYL